MSNQKLIDFLNDHRIKYSILSHSPAYTAMEVAAAAHIPGKQMAKTVMVRLDGKLAMAVVPSSYRVDLEALARELGAKTATLAEEKDFAHVFPGCEVGGMPPFGNLWKLPVYISDTLAEDKTISFNAGNHFEIMTLAFHDYRRLVEPKVLRISKLFKGE
jgi:Ala-tRNA(Pro) deacylase